MPELGEGHDLTHGRAGLGSEQLVQPGTEPVVGQQRIAQAQREGEAPSDLVRADGAQARSCVVDQRLGCTPDAIGVAAIAPADAPATAPNQNCSLSVVTNSSTAAAAPVYVIPFAPPPLKMPLIGGGRTTNGAWRQTAPPSPLAAMRHGTSHASRVPRPVRPGAPSFAGPDRVRAAARGDRTEGPRRTPHSHKLTTSRPAASCCCSCWPPARWTPRACCTSACSPPTSPRR